MHPLIADIEFAALIQELKLWSKETLLLSWFGDQKALPVELSLEVKISGSASDVFDQQTGQFSLIELELCKIGAKINHAFLGQ